MVAVGCIHVLVKICFAAAHCACSLFAVFLALSAHGVRCLALFYAGAAAAAAAGGYADAAGAYPDGGAAAPGTGVPSAADPTMRQLVEQFAADSGLEFLPKAGRRHEGLQVGILLQNHGGSRNLWSSCLHLHLEP